MRLGLWIAFLATLTACQPSDQSPETLKEQLNRGEVVVFNQTGERPPTCYKKSADWNDLRVTESLRKLIVAGASESVIVPNHAPCYRIGSVVRLVEDKRVVPGQVRIARIYLSYLENIEQRHLKGRVFASREKFDEYKYVFQKISKGPVSVVQFEYVKGSAIDEKAIEEEDRRLRQGDGYQETQKDGESLSSCDQPWRDVYNIPEEFQVAIQDGRLKSWFQFGERNCLRQGQLVRLKATREQTEFSQATVRKIKRFKSDFVDPRFFALNGLDYIRLNAEIQRARQGQKNGEWMTVVDFDLTSKQNFAPWLKEVE